MSRRGHRARLESGLKLDINSLARRGFITPGAVTGPIGIQWTNRDWDAVTTGIISADLSSVDEGWIDIFINGSTLQRVITVSRPRHFGGRQWFFMCPYRNRRCTVLWRPPGATRFASRERWGSAVAYTTQFLDRDNRAHRGKARLVSRLCRIEGYDADEWDFPPKPKWMRWATYERAQARFEAYDATLDEGIVALVSRFERNGWLK